MPRSCRDAWVALPTAPLHSTSPAPSSPRGRDPSCPFAPTPSGCPPAMGQGPHTALGHQDARTARPAPRAAACRGSPAAFCPPWPPPAGERGSEQPPPGHGAAPGAGAVPGLGGTAGVAPAGLGPARGTHPWPDSPVTQTNTRNRTPRKDKKALKGAWGFGGAMAAVTGGSRPGRGGDRPGRGQEGEEAAALAPHRQKCCCHRAEQGRAWEKRRESLSAGENILPRVRAGRVPARAVQAETAHRTGEGAGSARGHRGALASPALAAPHGSRAAAGGRGRPGGGTPAGGGGQAHMTGLAQGLGWPVGREAAHSAPRAARLGWATLPARAGGRSPGWSQAPTCQPLPREGTRGWQMLPWGWRAGDQGQPLPTAATPGAAPRARERGEGVHRDHLALRTPVREMPAPGTDPSLCPE